MGIRIALLGALIVAVMIVESLAAQTAEFTTDALPALEIHGWTPPLNGSSAIPPHTRATLSTDALDVVASNTQFGLDIYQRLSSNAEAKDNVLVSPFSISAALAMTFAGARGQTAEQMASVLGFDLPAERLHPAFGELLRDLSADREGYQLSIANRLFGQSDYPFKNPFLDITNQAYGAPLEPVDFHGDPEGSRKHINDWVAEQTEDKIQNLLPQGSVTPDMRLVLTNAIYFNGTWKYKFDKDATRDDSFFDATGSPTEVPMMFQQNKFRYAERPGYQMLEMPYAGDDLSMVVLLPREHDGLAALESSLTPDSLAASLAAMYATNVNVTFPKFTFENKFNLLSVLRDMGMTDALSPGLADFSGIAADDLSIGMALHKSFIAVKEEGTEAAAATAIGVVVTTAIINPPQPKEFRVNHPFLFALRDNHSGSLLFIGRVSNVGELQAAAAVPEPAAIVMMLAIVALWPAFRRR